MPAMTTSISAKEHQLFAALSGDYNPLHTDPILARRLLFGKAVVHGIHLVLKAIDCFASFQNDLKKLGKLKCTFVSVVGVEDPINITWRDDASGQILMEIFVGSERAVELETRWVEAGCESVEIVSCLSKIEAPQIMQTSAIQFAAGAVGLMAEHNLLRSLFPHLCEYLPVSQIAVLLATTRIVGMKCPGYHSVYYAFNLDFERCDTTTHNYLQYKVLDVDHRFNLVSITVNSINAVGLIKAFIRPAPIEQPSSTQLKGIIKSNSFPGVRYLIVGGSRGIGEISAKLLALGGADVRITYFRGEEDAHRVVADIHREGGKAQAIKYNVQEDAEVLLQRLSDWKPTHLIYCVTPFIFQGKRGFFSYKLFGDFASYYVEKFAIIFSALHQNSPLIEVFYPSTTAIDEQPPGMSEYVAAKSAGEVVCAYLAKSYPKVVFKVPRFPRVATDQTASLLQIPPLDPVDLIVEHLKG